MTDVEVIDAIRKAHLKANIDHCERDTERWGAPQWDKAWLDPGGAIYGPGPYLKVPIRGGEWDGMVRRVYAPARLRRRLSRCWIATVSPEAREAGSADAVPTVADGETK